MNSFAALQLDSDEEEAPQVKKGATTTAPKKAVEPKKPAAPIPGAPKVVPGKAQDKDKKPTKQPPVAAVAAPELPASEPTDDKKPNDRGGRANERYGGHGKGRGDAPHARRHENDRSGRVGKDGSRGGRGPGGWGSAEEEAHKASKNHEGAVEDATGADEPAGESEEVAEVDTTPAVVTYEEFLARRNASRSNSELFGAVTERVVTADTKLQVLKKKVEDSSNVKETSAKKEQRVAKAVVLDANYTVASATESSRSERPPRVERTDRPPREFRERTERPEGGREGGREGRGGRGAGRGGRGAPSAGRGAGRGPKATINAEDFPAL